MSNEISETQRAHLNNRLSEIERDKIQAKTQELFGAGNEHRVTWGEMFAAIKAGEVTLKEGEEDRTDAYLLTHNVTWPAREAKVAKLEAYRAQLRVERQAVYDRFVFNNIEGLAGALDDFAMS